MTDRASEFQNAGERVLTRRTVDRELKENKTIGGIKLEVRQRKERWRALTRELAEQLMNPDDQYLKLNRFFYDELSKDNPEIVATGLCGSGALGGVKLRKESGAMEHVDYDSLLIVRPGTESADAYRIQDSASQLLENLLVNNDPLVEGLPRDFHFCAEYNFRKLFLVDLTSLSAGELTTYLTHKLLGTSLWESAKVLNYFMPTYPPEVGERNQSRLLEFLRSLPREKWKVYSNALKDAWREQVTIAKPKQLLPLDTLRWSTDRSMDIPAEPPAGRSSASVQRDIQLAGSVSGNAQLLSYELFEELIDSTRPS